MIPRNQSLAEHAKELRGRDEALADALDSEAEALEHKAIDTQCEAILLRNRAKGSSACHDAT